MFEGFSDNSIRAIMLAQEKARELGLSQIDADIVIYGLLVEHIKQAVPGLSAKRVKQYSGVLEAALKTKYVKANRLAGAEITFSTDIETVFANARKRSEGLGSPTVEPEHIIRELVSDPKVASSWVSPIRSLYGYPGITFYGLLESDPTNTDHTEAVRPRSLEEWFSTEAIQVVSQAEEHAQADGSDKITVDHLLSSLIPACTWVPPHIFANLASFDKRHTNAGARKKAKTNTKITFGEEITTVFINARAEAAQRGCENIGPEHLLAGLLRSVNDGKVDSALCKETAIDELYREVKEALSGFSNTQIPPRTQTLLKPLIVDKDRVHATSRFVSTIKRALELAHLPPEQAVDVSHLARALIESARASEVAFVQNHTESLAIVEEEIAHGAPDACLNLEKKPKSSRKLESIARRASDHAERLQSNLLDINHLGLALLDEDHAAVDLIVGAFGKVYQRDAVRRRLEWCLLYQKFQSGYQSEPGEIINLRKLDQPKPA